MIRNKFLKLNDGVVNIYREKSTNKTDFNAKKNTRRLEDMIFVVKLCYEQMSKRTQDLEFANQNGFILSLKLKTRPYSYIDNKCKCVIKNKIYDISYIDFTKKECYIYLSGGIEVDITGNQGTT